jgi:hypothetical protein
MNKCLMVYVPPGIGKRAAPSAPGRSEVRLALRLAAQNATRFSRGGFRSGLSGTPVPTALIWRAFRLVAAVMQLFWALPRRPAIGRLVLHSSSGDSQGRLMASGSSRALATVEPGRNRHDRSFRGMWAQSKTGARFERKRLMRMNHRLPDEDGR